MASGWNLWVWLVSVVVMRYIAIYIIGKRSEPPLSVELSEFSLYLYIIYRNYTFFRSLKFRLTVFRMEKISARVTVRKYFLFNFLL